MQKFNMVLIDGDLILDKINNYDYSNKPLKNWDYDNFVEYIKDCLTSDFVLLEKNCLLYSLFDIYYLADIPEINSRVYLYGVWVVIKDYIVYNEIYVTNKQHKAKLKRRINKWYKAKELSDAETRTKLSI